jgi:hypothetical protein
VRRFSQEIVIDLTRSSANRGTVSIVLWGVAYAIASLSALSPCSWP